MDRVDTSPRTELLSRRGGVKTKASARAQLGVSRPTPRPTRQDGGKLERSAWRTGIKDEMEHAEDCSVDAQDGAEAESRGETQGYGTTARRKARSTGGASERAFP